MRARLALLLVGGVLGLVIAPSASADRFFARGPAPVRNLTAYNGLLGWGGPAGTTGPPGYYVSRGGAVTTLQIGPPRLMGLLGRIDLGRDRHGGTAVVYERCAENCDIYRYGLGTHRSKRVRGAASRHLAEAAPAVWSGRVVFERTRLNRRGDSGPRLGLFENSPFARLARPRVAVTGTDLRSRTVAYATAPSGSSATKIFVKRIGRHGRGRSCRIARATEVTVDQPRLDGRYVYWLRADFGGSSQGSGLTIHRRRLPTRNCHSRGPEQLEPRSIPGDPGNFAVDRGRLFYSSTAIGFHYDIFEMQPVSFVNR